MKALNPVSLSLKSCLVTASFLAAASGIADSHVIPKTKSNSGSMGIVASCKVTASKGAQGIPVGSGVEIYADIVNWQGFGCLNTDYSMVSIRVTPNDKSSSVTESSIRLISGLLPNAKIVLPQYGSNTLSIAIPVRYDKTGYNYTMLQGKLDNGHDSHHMTAALRIVDMLEGKIDVDGNDITATLSCEVDTSSPQIGVQCERR